MGGAPWITDLRTRCRMPPSGGCGGLSAGCSKQRITVIASSSVISPSNPRGIRAHRTGKSAHTGGRLGRASLVFLHRREATWEKKPYLTVDNQMTRNPNLALNAEIESMAERLTQTARDPK